MNTVAIEVTKEEEEAMNAITQASAEVLHNNQTQLDPQRIIDEMVAQFSIKLSLLLTTVIMNQTKAQPNTTPPEGDQSLQDCVDAVLEQAGWVGEKLDKAVVEYMENDVDWSDIVHDPVSNAVEYYFDHGFSLTDHCDIDDIVADKIDDRLEEMVNEKIREMLSTATITFNNERRR
jgi:hypothetical protein